MACKCTQTTTNATGGGAITSALSACSYVFWYNQMSGCTGSALDTHNGNPGANILFQLGINDNGYPVEAYGTNNISIDNPNPLHRFSIGNQGNIDVEEYIHFGDGALTGNTGNNKTGTVGDVYLGYKAGYTRGTNYNSSYNTVVGTSSLGSTGVLNAATRNTVVGYQTMTNATSSENNVIIGYQAGKALTTGGGNVYLGHGQGILETTENATLRIGNKTQTAGGSTRPLIQGDFTTSATTLWGSARITDLPGGLHALVGVNKQGYLHVSKFKPSPTAPLEPLGFNNMGVWTANTVDASGAGWDLTGTVPGYRSVSISGGTNNQSTNTDWAGTRVGIGTQFPEYPLHVKAPYAWVKVQSTTSSSWIESQATGNNAYLGVSASNGVKSGSTSWRMHAFTSNNAIYNWKEGAEQPIGTGMTLQIRSQSNGDETVSDVICVLGDNMSNNLDGAIVVRSDENPLGGASNPTQGVGIFTPIPTKELTLIGSFSGTGSIHSTNYMKWPDAARSMYLGYGINSGTTASVDNTIIGYEAASLNVLDTAASNTAVGTRALKTLETGDRNVAIGHQSLLSLTSGQDNIGIGFSSNGNITSTKYNVSIGTFAGLTNNSADSNTAIGYSSLLTNASGNNNTAVGTYSLYTQSIGSYNSGFGYESGRYNTLGKGNTSVGHKSLRGTSANANSWNSAVGSGSLSGITTGGCNVAVGNNAGAGIQGGPSAKITTGSKNIVIGCQVDVKGGTNDNQINIGNTFMGSFGTGTNTIISHGPIDPIKTHDVYTDGDIIIKPTVGLILSGSTLGTTIEGPIRTKDVLTFSNTIIGEMAVKYDTKASTTQQNTVVGYQSLSNPAFTGSIKNTTLGYKTLSGTTTSRENTAIGANSQQANTTGGFNTTVGSSALLNNQTGGYNVALGGNALQGVAANSNSQNVSVGYESGLSVTTGNANVFLGYQAGRTLTSGTNNICIGAGTNAVDATGTRQINIGNVIYGRDVANTGAINSIGIGTTTPGAPGNSPAIPFTVNGAISGTTRLYLGGATAANNNWIDGTQGGSGNDLYINSGNDVEIIASDDITLEAVGRVEFTEKGAAEPSMAIDLNDVSGQAFIENYSGNEVIGINASTRRLYFLWQGAIPATQQTWISGNESNGGEIDLTIGSSNDVIFSATSIGMGTTLPKTKLDVHHDPTGLVNNTGGGEVVTFGSAGADYAAGFLVQLRGASNWVKADADDTTQQGSLLGIALGAAPSDGILLKGFYKINTADDVTTWTNGGQLYVSVTDGKITESTGSMGSGDYVRVVGYMTTTTNVIYFNPESTYLVVT